MKLPDLTGGFLWKVATGLAGVATLVLGFMLISAQIENRVITKQRDQLTQQITDPKTGYVARLTQANANVAVLQTAVAEQNTKYEKLSRDSKAALAASEARLAAAQARTRTMQKKLDGFLATKPQGVTLEDRIRDIDTRAMSEFVP
jgi:hypothetical protein